MLSLPKHDKLRMRIFKLALTLSLSKGEGLLATMLTRVPNLLPSSARAASP